MHRRCVHAALGSTKAHRRIATGLARQYASPAAGSTRLDPSTPPNSKPGTASKPLRRRSDTTSKKKADTTAFDKSCKSRSTPTEPLGKAKTLPKEAELAFRSHSVWKKASVRVSRSPRLPKARLEEESISPLHPLLLRDKPLPGEWEPTPVQGKGFTQFKRLLLKDRPSPDLGLQAMTDAEDAITTVADDMDWIEMSFTPGTFVETRKNESHDIAVVLSEMIEDQKWKVLSLSMSGEAFPHLRQDVQFAIPGFVSSDLAARCGSDRITEDPKHVNARIEVLKKLKQVNMDVETAYQTDDWTRQQNLNIYNETRSVDPTRWAKTTVKHVTHLMWQEPRYFHYYAVHKYLMEHPLYFVATDNCLASQTFHVRPLRDVEEVETVENSIAVHRRDQEGPLSQFIRKARQVIKRYWTKRNANESGPVTQKPAEHSWNEADQIFLRFLLRSLAPWRSVQKDPYGIAKVNLMKFLYPKIYNITDVAIFQCLKELGVVASWHDPLESLHHANPTGDFYSPDPYHRDSEKIAKRTFQSKPVAGTVLGPEDLHPVDPLDSVRHDFGNMRVFVIDEASAEELDDGVSVERIPSEPDKYWVHTHIADPASLLHPGHILSLRARERGSTLYFRQKTFPLFPQSVIHDPFLGLSLGTRSRAFGDRTLTFSTKLDMAGNILDHKIRAGIIRNIHKITYVDCDELLGLKPLVQSYPFGRRRAEEKPKRPSTLGDEVGDLKLLLQLAQQQVKRRFAANIFTLDSDRASVDVLTGADSGKIQIPSMTGSTFSGFPEMEYCVRSTANMDQGSRMIVSEMMKLASRVASRVALEHGLPLIRRALDPIIPVSDKAAKAMLQARSANGYIPMYKFLGHMALTPASVYTLEPRQHCGVGVPEGEGYSRATSPLRRFEDMVVHWQLHHLLLGPKAPAKYPFNSSEMEQLCVDIATLDKMNRKLHMADESFHNLLFMKHWMEETEKGVSRSQRDPLAGKLTAFKLAGVKRSLVNNAYRCGVTIPQLGVKAQLVDLEPKFHTLPVSSAVRVRVKNIDLAVNQLTMDVVLAE